MGKKATKAADNMYYLARCEAAETNADFSSREKAAELCTRCCLIRQTVIFQSRWLR